MQAASTNQFNWFERLEDLIISLFGVGILVTEEINLHLGMNALLGQKKRLLAFRTCPAKTLITGFPAYPLQKETFLFEVSLEKKDLEKPVLRQTSQGKSRLIHFLPKCISVNLSV